MRIVHYSVGKCTPSLIGKEGIVFDMTDSGPILVVRFDRPTTEEIQAFQADEPLELRMTEMKDIIFMTFKFSRLNWMDAPYNVNLSANLTKLIYIKDGMGYGTMIVLCDTSGIVHAIRYFAMTTNFSRALNKAITEQLKTPFDYEQYCRHQASVYRAYSSKDLSRFASCYMKI